MVQGGRELAERREDIEEVRGEGREKPHPVREVGTVGKGRAGKREEKEKDTLGLRRSPREESAVGEALKLQSRTM